MENRCYAIKNNKIVSVIIISPFSKERMDKFCEEEGYDSWIELDKESALLLMQFN